MKKKVVVKDVPEKEEFSRDLAEVKTKEHGLPGVSRSSNSCSAADYYRENLEKIDSQND